MQQFSKEVLRMASLVLAICISTPATAQDSAGSNEQLMNLVMQIQQLQDEVRMLRGQLEEQSYEIESLKRRQRDQYLDLDQRLTELSGGAPVARPGGGPVPRPGLDTTGTAASSGTHGSTGASTEPQVGPRPIDTGRNIDGAGVENPASPPEDVPEVREAIDHDSTITTLATPEVASRTVAATPEMEQEAYDTAFQALKELRYADAAEGFQSFLTGYPDSDLADNAQYWLGESYYVTRNYDIALESFQQLLGKYPDSAKAGDGLLKIGFTHYELKNWAEARAALEQVQQRYPDSTLSRLAESRLRSMRLEGHL